MTLPARRLPSILGLFAALLPLLGWIGAYYETMPTTTFWLLHAGCALASGLCFVF